MKKALCLLLVCAMLAGMLPAAGAAGSIDRFIDVPSSNCWFTKSVQYVNDNGLMNGISENLFDPEGPATRAMVVTVLHRMAGTPTVQSEGFDDVPADDWFTAAVHWAQANNIIQGFGDGTFRPHLPMNRQEMIAVFYRYALYKNYDTTLSADLSVFVDHADIADFATESMSWSVAAGLINGFPDQTIRPTALSTRAQMATILMRYADINQIPDNGNDEEDTEVTEDDTSILSASQYEVEATSYTTVAFYVNSTLTVPSFELYVDGSSTGIYLYDDGNYDSNGDDIPNDGCYTGMLTIDFTEENDYTFYAVTTVGEDTIKTNDIDIFVYYELTDDEMDDMDLINSQIQQIIDQTREENPSASNEDLLELLRQNILAYLKELESQGRVYGIIDDPENHMITFRFACGVAGGVLYDEFHDEYVPIEDGLPSNHTSGVSSTRSSVSNTAITPNVSIDADYITYRERALLLCYDAFVNGWNGASLDDCTTNLTNSLTEVGFEVDDRYSVTVSDFLNMQEYDYIHVACHGTYYTLWTSPVTNNKTPVICTPEVATKATRKTYSADLKKDRIVEVSGHYFIRPSFFDFHYGDEPLKANLVSLGCCQGAYTDDLCNAIVSAGAGAVMGYSDTVYTAYDYMMSAEILDEMYQGRTISQALSHAQSVYGADDLVWGADQRDNGNTNFNQLKPERAEARLFGNTDQKLHHSLRNGNFDHILDVTLGTLLNWSKYGDARSIFRLAGIEPQSAPRMAIISSGFGSMGSETTSSIYQTFLVPGNATTIEFAYDVVSEEPMEYVGTIYDDIIQVDLLDTDGNILETLAYESVNTSTWYSIEGIDFPGGDHTTYHTRWNKVSSNVLSKYQGQLVVIRFVVQDAGDSIYDTALLVDSVRVK